MKRFYSIPLELFFPSAIILLGWHCAIAVPVQAQIKVDGTTNTTLTPIENGIRIDDGDKAGDNLFHSFEQFSVLNGSEAFFNNADNIINIFSRVTGGEISTINGLMRANGTANLFLLNPAGIIFGEGAQLDIGGSFLGSTANSIVFPEGKFLATDAENPPVLTINMPIGLNLPNNPGDIVNQSVAKNGRGLAVATGETITLVGGDVDLEGGRIFAPGGRVELGGLSTTGEIGINADGSLSFPEGVARADVSLSNSAEVNVQAAGGGSIRVNARNLEISGRELGASFLRAGIAPESNSPEAQAGDIILKTTGTITVSKGSGVINRVAKLGVGNAGGINITTTHLFLTEGSRVDASTGGQGDAGAVIINAASTISAEGETQEGDEFISTGIISRIQGSGEGNAGGINITTNNLYLTKGGRVSTSTFGKGNAGPIIINAADTISAKGATQEGIPSGIFSVILPNVRGNSEGVNITTTNLYLMQGSRVSSRTVGKGNAGPIIINAANTISVDGQTQKGFASGIVSLAGESGEGNAGDLKVQANSLVLKNGALLSASTPVGTGGNVILGIADELTLQNNSTISARASRDANGGNVNIDADFVVAFPNQNNDIIASASQGNGGDINITTQGIFGIEERSSDPPNNTNDLDASSEFGLDGTIAINQLDVNPAEALEELPTSVIDVTGLVAQNLCQQLEGSEFIVTGKGGIAPNPSQVRDGEVIEVDLVEPAPFVEDRDGRGVSRNVRRGWLFALEEVKEEIVEAQGWMINDRGILELVAYKTNLDDSTAKLKDANICPK